MSKILIPRSDSISAKTIVPTDFEKYFTNDIQDYVVDGFTVTGSTGTNRDVDITSGTIRLKGMVVNNSANDTNAYTFSTDDTHYLYVQITRDGNGEPESWDYTSNTTGTTPTDAIMIAKVVTAAGDVSSVDQTADFKKMHHMIAYVGSGTEIAALSPTYAGMLAYCSVSAGNFYNGVLYARNKDNDDWYPLGYEGSYYGDGTDGSATNATPSTGTIYNYTDLTINSTVSWGSSTNPEPIFVKVSGTLDLTGTINVTSSYDTRNSASGGSGNSVAAGGHGGKSASPVFIFAKNITGTGTINVTAENGGDGAVASSATAFTTASNLAEDGLGTGFGARDIAPTAGDNGGVGNVTGTGDGDKGVAGGINFDTISDFLNPSSFINTRTGRGAGGGAGALGTGGGSFTGASSGAGGAGASTFLCKGGDGGEDNGVAAQSSNTGGSGGGGGSASIVIIADSCSGITVNVTGGDGGDGGEGWSSGGQGEGGCGGGGGAACALIISGETANPVTVNLTAGSGGALALGQSNTGKNGSAGSTKLIYVQSQLWKALISSGL